MIDKDEVQGESRFVSDAFVENIFLFLFNLSKYFGSEKKRLC